MKFWTWSEGRQKTGYRKMLLACGMFWDLYLIDYPANVGVKRHTDSVPGKEHHRINLVLTGATTTFKAMFPKEVRRWFRFVYFRPDANPHLVEASTMRRIVLSLGWVRSRKGTR